MIVRFFKTGLSKGEAPVNYLLRDSDHAGDKRANQPEILFGNPDQTIRLINDCSRKHKYSSGVIAFRAKEQPSRDEIYGILDRFRATIAPGISPDQFNSLFVLHRDPPEPKTGLVPFHVHFVIPMTFLSGETPTGKPLAGKRFNPHPPGKQSQETMALFTAITNHEHGWKQVVENPLRVGIDSFWRKIDGQTNERRIGILQNYLTERVKDGTFSHRDDLIQFIQNDLGCDITRQSDTYISVRLPHFKKSVRLKGKMFEAKTDYAREFSTHSPNSRTVSSLTVPEYNQAKERLNQLMEDRKPYLMGIRPKPSTTTTKEKNDGKQPVNRAAPTYPRRVIKAAGIPQERDRLDKLHSDGTNSQDLRGFKFHERFGGRLQTGNPVSRAATTTSGGHDGHAWIGGNGSNSRATGPTKPTSTCPSSSGGTPRTARSSGSGSGLSAQNAGTSPEQYRSDPSQSGKCPTQTILPAGITSTPMTALDIDEEIRKLCISQASASYEGQARIQEAINRLVGRRQNLPKPR